MTLSIISGLLAIPLIVIASFGEVDALGPWDVGELECTLDYQIPYARKNPAAQPSTVAGRGKISKPSTAGTSKLD